MEKGEQGTFETETNSSHVADWPAEAFTNFTYLTNDRTAF